MIDLSKQGAFSYMVLGDAILDDYIYGRSTRVSPEAPAPIVVPERRELCLGGAANVAHHFVKLGSRASLASRIGADPMGNSLLEGIVAARIGSSSARSGVTPHKTRIVANRQQIVRLDEEDTLLDPEGEDSLCRALKAEGAVSAVIVSDYAKGSVTAKTMEAAVALSQRSRCPLIVDPKRDLSFYRGASALTPNEEEIKGDPLELVNGLGLKALVVTRGARGLSIYLPPDNEVAIPSEAREVYDVTGAGDTVTAMLAVALANGLGWVEAARFANKAAGLVVASPGTTTPDPVDLANPSKVLIQEELLSRVGLWKEAGRRIVFTNGCFDLIHVGHIRLLAAAKAEGDILIVGLDSDESIRKLKGPERPRVTASRRAEVLAALESTTVICVFDRLEELIKAVAPDVLVKGADYAPEEVIGFEHAGKLVLVPLVPGASSTGLISA